VCALVLTKSGDGTSKNACNMWRATEAIAYLALFAWIGYTVLAVTKMWHEYKQRRGGERCAAWPGQQLLHSCVQLLALLCRACGVRAGRGRGPPARRHCAGRPGCQRIADASGGGLAALAQRRLRA
jgi:hypothetical protein